MGVRVRGGAVGSASLSSESLLAALATRLSN
ncbi:MAG: hypothetical protein ABR514_02060 [Chthoniobacterales bacterium]